MTYTILGLSDGPEGHVELHDESSLAGAKQWVDLYTKYGNWGGYYGIAIISPTGNWEAVYSAPEGNSQ